MTAKFNLLVVTAIPAFAIAPLIACGGDSAKTPDAANGSGSGSGSNHGSGSGSGSNNVCLLPTSLSSSTTFAAQLIRYRNGAGSGSAGRRANRLSFAGALDANGTQQIRISIYGGCGATGSACTGNPPNTPDWPALFGPSQAPLDLTQVIDANAIALVTSGTGSNTTLAALYALSAGTLNVTAAGNGAGSAFAGTLNATLVHVDLGSNSVTPDPDGCTTTVSSLSFSGSAMFSGKTFIVNDLDEDAVLTLHHRYQ